MSISRESLSKPSNASLEFAISNYPHMPKEVIPIATSDNGSTHRLTITIRIKRPSWKGPTIEAKNLIRDPPPYPIGELEIFRTMGFKLAKGASPRS